MPKDSEKQILLIRTPDFKKFVSFFQFLPMVEV